MRREKEKEIKRRFPNIKEKSLEWNGMHFDVETVDDYDMWIWITVNITPIRHNMNCIRLKYVKIDIATGNSYRYLHEVNKYHFFKTQKWKKTEKCNENKYKRIAIMMRKKHAWIIEFSIFLPSNVYWHPYILEVELGYPCKHTGK